MYRFIGKCSRCKATYTVEGKITERIRASFILTSENGRKWRGKYLTPFQAVLQANCCASYDTVCLREVVGVTTERECDARCTGAKGHQCSCSCGGANHGQSFMAS